MSDVHCPHDGEIAKLLVTGVIAALRAQLAEVTNLLAMVPTDCARRGIPCPSRYADQTFYCFACRVRTWKERAKP